MEYPKIKTLYERDPKTLKIKEPYILTNPVFDEIKTFYVTEKIDGMNIRIILNEDGTLNYRGRTDAAQLPPDLFDKLTSLFTPAALIDCFWNYNKKTEEPAEPFRVILFGEGYGAGIQKLGHLLSPHKDFMLFDILIKNKHWMSHCALEKIAEKLNIKMVPFLGRYYNDGIANFIKTNQPSRIEGAHCVAEGIVAKPKYNMFDNNGGRIIFKLKTLDFKN